MKCIGGPALREFNLLGMYPKPQNPRFVGPKIRTIQNKINASYRDERYYDGDRRDGYGGFKYDGRWKPVVDASFKEYDLTENSSVLHLGCEKGFLLHDFKEKFPKMNLRGYEMARYPIDHAMENVKGLIDFGNFENLPYKDHEFDLVIAIGVVYCLTLRDAIACLKEIQRVGKGKSFITLGSYRTEEERRLFQYWTVLGTTYLHIDDWKAVLNHVGYTGDVKFMTAEDLNLQWTEKDWSEVTSG